VIRPLRLRALALLLAASAVLVLALAGVGSERVARADAPAFRVKVTNNNLVGLTVSNYGFFGNNFTSRSPSFEYPLGTGFEHMVRGGLWIGGLTDFNDDSLHIYKVTTGAVDGSQGTSTAAATEFTPAGGTILERSSLGNSKVFSKDAISEQDFVTDFNDFPAKSAVTGHEDHLPLGLAIHQETYDWSFSKFANFVAAHFTFTNKGRTLDSLYVGFYSELASGPKNAYGGWPPSASGSALGSWYNKKLLQYDAPSRLISEHYCKSFSGGFPTCLDDVCPPFVGIQLLGVHPDTVSNKKVTLFIANYDTGDTTRDQDIERYNIMSSGHIAPADSLLPGFASSTGANDPVEMLAVGPFDQVAPDSSVTVDFAFVGGATYQDLLDNAHFAQLAFNFNYVIPTPPPSPSLAIVPADHALDLYWDNFPEQTVDKTSPQPGGKDWEGYRVYVGQQPNTLTQVAQFEKVDTTGFNTGLAAITLADSVQVNGKYYQYHYRITGLKDGFRYYAAVTAFDMGDTQIEPLESGIPQNQTLTVPAPNAAESKGRGVTVFPNPYHAEAAWDAGRVVRDHYLWFANLPKQCTIDIFTLSGDKVKSIDFNGDTYNGSNARGLFNPATDLGVDAPTLSGTVCAWDLITERGQAVASGLYLFSVRDRTNGAVQRGKFLVVKSDKESL